MYTQNEVSNILYTHSNLCRCVDIYSIHMCIHAPVNNRMHRALLRDRKEEERQKEESSNKYINK